ncbi:hypothetical protein JXQ70_18365 [bacterium]|nr:hypothetical protein [bacterium]
MEPKGAYMGVRIAQHRSTLLIVVLIYFIVTFLIVYQPVGFFEPDEFCYYFSARNFQEGRLSLTADELSRQRHEAGTISPLWPHDLGYVHYKDHYVLVKAPGYSSFLAMLRVFGIERLANIVLAGASVLVLLWSGLYCFQTKSEIITATYLLLMTPISLIMHYRVYMSDYASAAVLFLGGMLVLIRDSAWIPSRWLDICLHLATGFLLGSALVLRFTNGLTVLFLVVVHLYFTYKPRCGTQFFKFWTGISLFLMAFLMPVMALFHYNVLVFGKMMATGYQLQDIRPQDTTFIFQQILRGYWLNVYGTIIRNLTVLPEILITGMPWIVLVPAAMIWGYRHLDRRLYCILAGWIVTVCLVYFQYRMLMPHSFVIISRMYLPLIGPSVILIALYVHQIHQKAPAVTLVLVTVISIVHFMFFLAQVGVPFFGLLPETLFAPVRDVLGLFYPIPSPGH